MEPGEVHRHNVVVARLSNHEIVDEHHPAWTNDATHLDEQRASHPLVEDRREHGRRGRNIECPVRKREVRAGRNAQINPWATTLCFSDAILDQVDACERFRGPSD
jgi:hypothetical protein